MRIPDGVYRRLRRVQGPLLALGLALCLSACSRVPDGPSLLLICADTVRADIFYHPDIDDELTPWLAGSQRYTRAMTTSPWTMPAVASVMTGLYPIQHGGGAFAGPVANLDTDTPMALSGDIETLAEVLAAHDFKTRGFSAHPWFKTGFGLDQGFQNFDFLGEKQPLIDRMLEWIGDLSGSARFFAYLHLMEVHELHRRPEDEIRQRFENFSEAKRQFLIDHANPAVCNKINGRRCIKSQAYMASILELRQSLADLLAGLEQTGRLEDTLVVLFSDHGEEFREHREQHRELQTDPRGMYGVGHGQGHFKELMHVPLVMWKPGTNGAGHDGLASLVDVFPTTLDWLGIESGPDALPGLVLPADSHGEPLPDRAVYASSIAFGPESIGIVSGMNKAIYWPDEDRFVFFDLEADPAETTAVTNDDLLIEFSTLAGDYLDMRHDRVSEAPQLDRQQIEDLKSIGYLQGVEDEPQDEENPEQ